MHYVKAKHLLSSNDGMNIYRGCSHGCIYCDSRSKCYNMDHDFEDIEVKINAPELLEIELRRKRKKAMIATGAMSDPYLHLEKELRLTRQCLQIINKYDFGGTVLTKSDMVLRDLDLIKEINSKSKFVVQMTITTFDDNLCKIIEPNVCPTSKRLEVLNTLKKENIPTVVWITPILPFINDDEDNILKILEALKKVGVKGIITFNGFGLTLREGDREYYYQNLDKYFPGIKNQYIRTYGNRYELPIPRNNQLNDIFINFCKENFIEFRVEKIFKYLSEYQSKNVIEEISLF